jgi:hypothetical protein
LSLEKGANYLAGQLAEEQRADARRAQAAVGVGNDLAHEDPEYSTDRRIRTPSIRTG